MQQTISTLNLSKYLIKKINDKGLNYVEDLIEHIDKVNINQDIKNDILESLNIKFNIKSALEIDKEEKEISKLTTFCKELDDVFEGGIPLQTITELCGAPGSGKTQFCLQLCVNIQIPIDFGGLESAAVYISTNNGFTVKRFKEIASACIEHCNEISKVKKNDDNLKKAVSKFTIDSILSNIHVMETNDYVELIAAVQSLNVFLHDKNIKLIVIDSISFPFRHDIQMLHRTRILHKMLMDLQEIASKHNSTIILTNEITTRPHSGLYEGLVPALGESFAHMIPSRILLGNGPEDERIALVDKSAYIDKVHVPFEISCKGIRDVDG